MKNLRQCSTENCAPVASLSERIEAYKTNCKTQLSSLCSKVSGLRKWVVMFVLIAVASTGTAAVAQWKADEAMNETERTKIIVSQMAKQIAEMHGMMLSRDKRVAIIKNSKKVR